MSYLPIIVNAGQLQQLPSDQALDVGGWTLPTSGGSENYVLTANVSGDAVWAEAASDFGDPTTDDQVLISTGVGTASWSTAGNDQILASDGSGDVAWTNKPFGYEMASPASSGELYQATGAGTASWTTTITSLAYIGIGTPSPQSQLHVVSEATLASRGVVVDQYSNNAAAAQMTFRKGRGIRVTPTPALKGDYIGAFTFRGWDGTSWVDSSGFGSYIRDTTGTNNVPTELFFYTTGGAHTTNPYALGQVRLIIRGDGNVDLPVNGQQLGFGTNQAYTIEWDGVDAIHTISSGTFILTGGDTVVDGLTTTGTVVGSNIPSPTVADEALISTGSGTSAWSRITGEDIDVGVIGSPTYTTIEDYINTTGDSGILSGTVVSDDLDGTITVAAGTGLIYTTDSDVGSLVFFDIDEDTTVGLTDNSMNFIYVEYNAGSPQFQSTTNVDNVSGTDEIIVGAVYKNGTDLHVMDVRKQISSLPRDIYYHAFKHYGIERSNGMVTSETGNRYLDVTAGQLSIALQFLNTPAFDSSGSDTFKLYYYDGAWQVGSAISQLPNTQYNDYGTGLDTLTAQRYGVYWLYMVTDGDVYGVYGTGDYLLSQAEAATAPSSLPDELATIGVLIAKVIFQNGGTNLTEIYIPWTSSIGSSSATDHGALAGLSDDDHPQYVTYTGASGTVDLGAENLTTTGTVVGSNVPAPTTANTMLVSTGAGAAAWADEISSFQIGHVIFQNDNEIDCNDGVDPATLSFVSDAQFSQALFLSGEVHRSCPELASEGNGYLFNGHRYETFTDQTGTLKITIPLSWANMASTMKIIGYDRTTGGWELLISGYADDVTDAWLGTAADLIGSAPFSQVRLAHDGTNVCILLGTTSTSWNDPSIGIDKNLVAAVDLLDLFDVWGMTFLDSESGITDIVDVPFESDTFGNSIAEPTTAGQLYRATGAGVASWTTDITGLTSLSVDNITINGAAITSDTGAISFDDENVSTTGNVSSADLTASGTITDGTASLTGGSLTAVRLGSLTTNGFVVTSGSDGTLSIDTSTYLTAENDNLDSVTTRGNSTTNSISADGGFSTTGTVVGSNIPSPTVTDKVLTSTGADTATWQDPMGHATPTAADQIYVGTGVGTADWTTDLANLTSLGVDNITIDAAQITSDTGAISFDNENLTTTGTLTSGQITATHNSFPTICGVRTTTVTNTVGAELSAVYKTTGNMTDGFGSGIAFGIEDDTSGEISIAGVYGIRDGADNSGSLDFYTSNAGSFDTRGRFTPEGNFEVDNGTIIMGDFTLSKPTAAAQLLRATAADAASWTTDITGLTSLGVDNITINGATITSDTGAISFGNENLTTTGKVTAGSLSMNSQTISSATGTISLNDNTQCVGSFFRSLLPTGGIIQAARNDTLLLTDEMVGSFEFYTNDASGSGDAAGVPGAIQYYCDGTWDGNLHEGHMGFFTNDKDDVVGTLIERMTIDNEGDVAILGGDLAVSGAVTGSNLAAPTASKQLPYSTGVGTWAWAAPGNDKVVTTNSSGTVVYAAKPFGYNMAEPTTAGQLYQATGAGAASWTRAITGLTLLTVDNITINGAAITSDTGAISFNDENVSTTGKGSFGTHSPEAYTHVDVAGGYAAGKYANQLHLHTENTTYGMFLGSWEADAGYISQGAYYWASGEWVPRTSDVVIMGMRDGEFLYYADLGETSGVNYTPTERAKINVEGVTTSGAFIGTQGNDSNQIYHDVYSYKGAGGVETGTLKITLPVTWNNTMLTVRIQGYNYTQKSGPWEVTVGGYLRTSTTQWLQYSAIKHGAYCPFESIRLAHDGTKCCILLGTTSTRWDYSQVFIVEVTAGYSSQDEYATGWECSVIDSESGITGIKTCRVDTSPRQIFSDETIYVTKSGNDTTGNGDSIYPFATPERAITELGKMAIGNNAITVDIGPGIYSRTTPLEFKHPFGGQVTFKGDYQKITGEVTTSISATNYDLATVSGNLDYYNVTITFTGGTTLSAGDYILISNASGGTNPDALNGCHKVESYSSDIATIRIVHRFGCAHASGTVNIDCVLVRTVLGFTMSNGFKADGPYHMGMWEGVVIQGDENHASCDYGIWMLNSPTILLREDGAGYGTVGIRGWQRGVYAQNNAMCFGDYNFVSCCHQYGIFATNGGVVNIRYGYVSGCNNTGLYALTGATIGANYCHVTGVGAIGILAYNGSWIDFENGVIKHATNDVLYAGNGAGVTATAEDVSITQVYYDSTATCSPARDTQGNGYGNMRGGPY